MTQIHHLLLSRRAFLGLGVMALLPNQILRAGAQKEETLSSNVATAMRHSIENVNQPYLVFATKKEADAWLNEMSIRLKVFSNSEYERKKILINAQYEAVRSGLDPQLILGLIEVESRFRRYAISKAGARGLMQVMPFWLIILVRLNIIFLIFVQIYVMDVQSCVII